MKNEVTNILSCLCCLGPVFLKDEKIVCANKSCNAGFVFKEGIYCFFKNEGNEELELSLKKWNRFYANKLQEDFYNEKYIKSLEKSYVSILQQISECKKITKNTVFLELGCGPMFLGRFIANRCKYVVGVDISYSILKFAKKLFDDMGIKNYILIQANLKKMPLRSNSIDLIYGGGVLEHSEDMVGSLREIYRVLKEKGVSFNTVPHLNLGSLTYRQCWGNIPNFPLLKDIVYFFHAKILGARLMSFGYELSFSARFMRKAHQKVGFKNIHVGKFETELLFEKIPFAFFKKIFTFLANNSPLFWPMLKTVGEK